MNTGQSAQKPWKTLTVRGPTYFSAGDEEAFFSWLQAIACVASVGGHGYDLTLDLKRRPGDADFRELIALFFRYRMNMKPLAALQTARNAKWFAENPQAFWHAKVFGKTHAKKRGD